jgi:hypothetical protein
VGLKGAARANYLSSPTITGTVTASGVTNERQVAADLGLPYTLAEWHIPFIHLSSGSMGNNGAITGLTALPKTYSSGAWVYLPANAIQAGSGAGWYWFVASSTTAGTVYNSTYTSGTPGLGTTTAFVSTGPGAFTGDTTQRNGPVITIPANAIGPNGSVRALHYSTGNTAAGAKNIRISNLNIATAALLQDLSTNGSAAGEIIIANRGLTNSQVHQTINVITATNTAAAGVQTVDTTASATVGWTLEKATATNHLILEGGSIELRYGA